MGKRPWNHLPLPNPTIDDLDDLDPRLLVALEYQIQSILNVHKRGPENRTFVQEDPLYLYTIACMWGFEDQAKSVPNP